MYKKGDKEKKFLCKMASPKHSSFFSFAPSVLQLDWDSPSAKTGTVKRRPNSYGETLSCFKEDSEDDPADPKERKASFDSSCDALNKLKNSKESLEDSVESFDQNEEFLSIEITQHVVEEVNAQTEEVLKIEDNTAKLNDFKDDGAEANKEIKKPTSLFVSGQKFQINKCGKVFPESATLFSPDSPGGDVITQQPKSKIREPISYRKDSYNFTISSRRSSLPSPIEPLKKHVVRSPVNMQNDILPKTVETRQQKFKKSVPKLKLTFSPSKTTEKLRLKMFPGKNIGDISTSPPVLEKGGGNECIELDTGAVNKRKRYDVISGIPSKIPQTPVDSENKHLYMSPNKKYTVTSQYGIRMDKENYVIYDPETGFDEIMEVKDVPEPDDYKAMVNLDDGLVCPINLEEAKKPVIVESTSDTDSGVISPVSPFESGGSDAERRYSRTSSEYGRLRMPGFCVNRDYENVFNIRKFANCGSFKSEEEAKLERELAAQKKIYTDWANHYLERGRSAKRVRALSECRDGDLLRDLLEAVMGQRVPVHRQYDTVGSCLHFLHSQRVQGLESVSAEDIREGKLKAILALFFALSRHKQAAKQQQKQQYQHQLSNNQLAGQHGGGSVGKTGSGDPQINRITGGGICEEIINTSTSNMVQHRQAGKNAAPPGTAIPMPRRARPLPPTPGSNGTLKGGTAVSASSSRSSSPGSNPRGNNILAPGLQNNSHGSRPNSSLLAPGSKIPSSPYSAQTVLSPGAPAPPPHQNQNVSTKHSMLDKLKLFKDKSGDKNKNTSVTSKRTSSSSGFSSAKSERSDSSLSLNEAHNHSSNNSHIKGPNVIHNRQSSNQINVESTLVAKENQKPSKNNVKSKIASTKTSSKDASQINCNSSSYSNKQQKNEKSSKNNNSPKLQTKEKESKIAPPKNANVIISSSKVTQNCEAKEENLNNKSSSKIAMKSQQDTKISRLSGSHQMKYVTDQKQPQTTVNQQEVQNNKVPIINTNENKVSTAATNIQSPKVNNVQSSNHSLTNSNSNSSFSSNPNMVSSQSNTGIPKPTAAVKGTSKLPKEEKTNVGLTKSSSSTGTQISPSHSTNTLMTNSNSSTPLPFNRELSNLNKEVTQKQTSVVSPMPNSNTQILNEKENVTPLANPAVSSQMSESSNSNSTHSASTGAHSNSSEGSVIYRPSSESGSEMSKTRHNPVIPNRKIDTTQYLHEIVPESKYIDETNESKQNIIYNNEQEKLEALLNNSKEKKTQKDLIIDRSRICPSPVGSHNRENSIGEDDNPSMNVLPMRPLLRGYNNHLTLPARTGPMQKGMPAQGYPHHANTVKANFGRENVTIAVNFRNGHYGGYASSEYCDVDIAAGYMSEGDYMRKMTDAERERERIRARAGDVMDGYMSEGGASLYGRRINAYHPGPGMTQFDERVRSHQIQQSQLNRSGNTAQATPVLSTMEQQQQQQQQQQQASQQHPPQYRVVHRPKKAEAGQQTDATNYKILNANGHGVKNGDSQWKKYTDSPGVGSPVQGGPPSPLSSRRRHQGSGASSNSSGGQQRGNQHGMVAVNTSNNGSNGKPQEKLSASQQLQVTVPPPHQMHYAPMNSGHHPSSKMGPGGQLQSPGTVSSQCSQMPPTPNGSNGGSSRVKGVPQSFGYVKRPHQQGVQQMQGGRTAQVSAVPRTKVKVSGGTQTCTQDLQIHRGGGVKSFSLSGSAASQLSQSVRERLMMGSQSLPKPGSHDFAVLFQQHHRVPPRGGMKISDGSLSDTQTYSDVKSDYGSPYTSWLRHSNTYSATGRLSECDSMESLQSLQPAGSSRAPPRLMHQPSPSRLNRSNSIRSTKSEKLYPSMLQRSSEGEYEPYYCIPVHYADGQGIPYGASEPPSPSPRSALSPPHTMLPPQHHHPPLVLPSQQHHSSSRHSHHYKKNDEAHGSAASLVSTASSLHSSAEERQAHEARKLRRELADAKEKVHTLTTQLTTNAHVVSAFEQSLSNMTQRLQQLTATAERKDTELTQLRQTIELLRKQSIQAGLTSAHMTSMGIKQDSVTGPNQDIQKMNSGDRSESSGTAGGGGSNMTRHLSTDSVSSLNSLSSGCSSAQDKKKKKGWLRSSFTKAFSRNAKISKTSKHSQQMSPGHDSSSGGFPDPSSGVSSHHHLLNAHHQVIREGSNENSLENSHEILAEVTVEKDKSELNDSGASNENNDPSRCDPQLVDELKKQLREKDLVLTDIRLEALSSAHQLESLKDTVIKMRNEMLNLKQNNERLQRLVRPKSLAGSRASLGAQSIGGNTTNGSGNNPPSPQTNNVGNIIGNGSHEDERRFSAADAQRSTTFNDVDVRPQPLDIDFNCITSTPTIDYKMQSPSTDHSGLYRASRDLGLETGDHSETASNGETPVCEQTNGLEDIEHELISPARLDDVECESNSILPAPKCRELAIGETYADLGLNENSADISDGKKIAIAVYLGQPDTFTRYYEEVCETLNNCESRFYSNRSSAAFNNCHQDIETAAALSRLSLQNPPQSPDRETAVTNGDFHGSPKSNTNSLRSNKSSHSTNYIKNNYNASENSLINCNEFVIAYTYISGKTTWQNLDYTVRKSFKDYLSRIDPGTNLGLNTDSITSYHLGEATRGPEVGIPELLPCGYIIGTVKTLYICLQGVGSLAFDSLIPKNIVYRYVSLLSEHRRVILCGPSGTGKSYLAARLAEFHVAKTAAHLNPAEAIATFNVEHKSSKELRQYLSNMAEQTGGESLLPSVLILDNLHHASALADVFSGLLGARRTNLPCIIGTMSQATCNTTNLQLHHNFRWLLTANHMEPVKGFLGRYLRRKQLVSELCGAQHCPRLSSVLEWLPCVWQHVNSFLEAHSSSDVTLGPRLFLACPLDIQASQAWFTSVWNYSVVPYLIEAAREGVALYGRRGAWADPAKFVRDTYPWPDPIAAQNLRGITLEDIGLDGNSTESSNTNNQDPLLNMLMRLQEAANYSGNHSQDSDNASLDSNLTHDSSAGNDM